MASTWVRHRVVKGGEEVRTDQRVEQLFCVMNGIMAHAPGAAAAHLQVKSLGKSHICSLQMSSGHHGPVHPLRRCCRLLLACSDIGLLVCSFEALIMIVTTGTLRCRVTTPIGRSSPAVHLRLTDHHDTSVY